MGWFGDRIMSQTPRQSGCPVALLPWVILGGMILFRLRRLI